jgi:hypothetical protein
MKPKIAAGRICLWLLLFTLGAGTALAQTTVFTYQGQLKDGVAPANGTYNMQFRLFDTEAVGTGAQVGPTFTPPPVQVTNGGFTVPLDFGAGAFPGAARYLEISVNGTLLMPRQQITSAPYAIRSLASTSADTATNSTQLGGVDSTRFVQQDAGANVAITGNFTVGGTFSPNIVNAQTQFNLGGNRILGNTGTDNFFVGIGAGASTTTGVQNSFFGIRAGTSNTGGSLNSFFGFEAGLNNNAGAN